MFETLGLYKILEPIGSGGIGELLRARDTRLGRTVAIRVVAPSIADDPAKRARFLEDARAAEALSHPNIAALYEIGEDQGALFLVFEFVPGETLKSTIAGRPMNPRRAIDLAVQIADALAEAHAVGVVHRDIRPGSILVTPKGNAKLLDFGLASWTKGGAEREQAATLVAGGSGTTMAIAPYLSPEQVLGEALDQRTDVFSLAIVLFEMATGSLPFAGTTPDAVALRIAQAVPVVPSSLNPELPAELDAILAKALSKSPTLRYEAAATLAAELRSVGAILDVRSDVSEAAAAAVVDGPPRSSKVWVVLLVLAAIGAAGWLMRGRLAALW
ncbi:MAG TPA: serine/threonine-protein kinase [Vicinamibacterales bacterium]|jgi:serine/threonine-protein kinase